MNPKEGGRPTKNGKVRDHKTERILTADYAWKAEQARKAGISVADFTHAQCEAARRPGTDAEKIVAQEAQLVFMQIEMTRLARELGKAMKIARDAQEKNFLLGHRMRTLISAFEALPSEIQRRLPDMMLGKAKRLLQENHVRADEAVVVV